MRGNCFVSWSSDHWQLYSSPRRSRRVTDPNDLLDVIREIFGSSSTHRAGWIAYEAASVLLKTDFEPKGADKQVYLEFAEFDAPERFLWLEPSPFKLDLSEKTLAWTYEDYAGRFERAHRYLADGTNYQTNLTFATEFASELDAADLFSLWCGIDPPRCARLSRIGKDVVSLSPEGFYGSLELRNGRKLVMSSPMKGTAPLDYPQDWLQNDPKSRAENLMIVDMVRNDLGRLSEVQDLNTHLFHVGRARNVWQMSSSVSCSTTSSDTEVFEQLFPAASITGAPKLKTMEVIDELETSPRGVYCGAVGVLGPDADGVNSVGFCVPIRTAESMGNGQWRFRVGSGIVWDSTAEEEYKECLLKAEVLDKPGAAWGLIETFRSDHGAVDLIEEHLARLHRSAQTFGVPLNEDSIREAMTGLSDGVYRLVVSKHGEIQMSKKDVPVPDVIRITRRPARNRAVSLLTSHKTTDRSAYRTRGAEEQEKERLWANKQGHLTEFTTGNLVVQLDCTMYTPPLSCGLLPGVARAHWIKTGKLQERVLTMEDLERAEAVYHLNAARGLRPVEFTD